MIVSVNSYMVDIRIGEDSFKGTPIEAAANSPDNAKAYNSTAMRFFPEKFEGCDFELHVSLSGSQLDYDEYFYAYIVTDESERIGEAIAFEKIPEFENISAEATGKLDLICTFTGSTVSKFEYHYGEKFVFDLYVLYAEGGAYGYYEGFDTESGHNVRISAFYPSWEDIGNVYRVYGTLSGFYSNEVGTTYLDFSPDKYDNVTREYS